MDIIKKKNWITAIKDNRVKPIDHSTIDKLEKTKKLEDFKRRKSYRSKHWFLKIRKRMNEPKNRIYRLIKSC